MAMLAGRRLEWHHPGNEWLWCDKQAMGQLTELAGMPGRPCSPQTARYVLICSPLSGLSGGVGPCSALRLTSNPSGCQESCNTAAMPIGPPGLTSHHAHREHIPPPVDK